MIEKIDKIGGGRGRLAGSPDKLMIAVETGIAGGSIALIEDGKPIDYRLGNNDVSRAEDILEATDDILESNGLTKKDIDCLVFSNGPGSYTGLRIGAAIILGLQKSLGCRLEARGLLPSLVFGEDSSEGIVAAVPFGGKQVCWSFFEKNSRQTESNTHRGDSVFASSTECFVSDLKNLSFGKLILHAKIFDFLSEADALNIFDKSTQNAGDNIVDAGMNMARYIGLAARPQNQTPAGIATDLIYPQIFSFPNRK